MVTRPGHQAGDFVEQLEALGAAVLSAPAIRLAPSRQHAKLLQAVREFSKFDWVIFTSVNGAHAVARAMGEAEVDPADLQKVKVAAIGPATSRELKRMAIAPTVMPDEFISDAIPELLGNIEGKKILLPRADIARKQLPEELRNRGAEVTEIEAYRIVPNDEIALVHYLEDQEQAPDYITFTSSSTVRGFHMLLARADKRDWFSSSKLVSIGPVTAETVAELGGSSSLTAKSYTTEGIIERILEEERGEK